MKYKVGDRVRIKSLNWYNANRDEYGYVDCGSRDFSPKMSDLCDKIATIKENCKTNCYHLEEYHFDWTDEMIECKVEEETLIERVDDNGLPFNEWLSHKGAFHVPDGYELKDENGNVINVQKIVLEKKKGYPKTYKECCKILGFDTQFCMKYLPHGTFSYKDTIIYNLQELLICRDAYWKLCGDEMGLGKPWEPDCNSGYFIPAIIYRSGSIQKVEVQYRNAIFSFPTTEMRDAFYENFKSEIEICKELL